MTSELESLLFLPGDYARVFIPGRQKLVPCQLEAIIPGGWVARPLKKCRVHRYHILPQQIMERINPKEVNHPCSPSRSPES